MDYCEIIDMLVWVGVVEDVMKIWWDFWFFDWFLILEMWVIDVCFDLEDVVVIVVLFRCFCCMLYCLC